MRSGPHGPSASWRKHAFKNLPKPACRRTTRTNIAIKCWGGVLLWGSRLHGFVLHRFFARIFCTDVLHGFFARIFGTDFLHRFFALFFARLFCADFCADCLQELFVQMFARIFARMLLGCPKTLAGKRQNFTEKIPPKIHHALGPFWGGAREAGGRGETLASLTRPESPRTGVVGGAPTETVAIPVDLDQSS